MYINKKIILFFTLAIAVHVHAEKLIESLTITKKSIHVKIAPSLHKKYLTSDSFFVEYDDSVTIETLDPAIATIPFILTVIPIIWISNKTYEIDTMDEDLYNALVSIKKVFQALFPSSKWEGNLIPKKLISHAPRQASYESAVLFSGGLDAVYSALTHPDQKQLLITIWGSDVRLNQNLMWNQVKNKCEQFAVTYHKDHTWCKSNFRTLIADDKLARACPDISYWWGFTSQALNYTGLIAPLCYLKGIPTLYIGSSHTVECPDPYGSHPLIDNCIAFAGTKVYHDGAQHNRMQKLREIDKYCKQNEQVLPELRVCWGNDQNGGNCMHCEKCVRTIIELIIAGLNPEDFGFNAYCTNLDASLRLHIKEILHSQRLTTTYHWRCIQNAIVEGMKTVPYSPEIYSLLFWICAQKIQTPKILNPARQKKLAELWQKSIDQTFTMHDLAILTTSIQNKKTMAQLKPKK